MGLSISRSLTNSHRCAIVLVAFAFTGCPANQSSTGPQAQSGAGCPTARGVFVAQHVTQESGKGRSGWVMPLHAAKVEAGVTSPEYTSIDAATASAAGAQAAPTGTLWLATPTAPPCRVNLGGYYAAKLPGPPASVSYGIELDGCPAPASPEAAGGIVLASEASPTG